ncbi:hypothetical protein [Actinocrispum wychmicini]|uniref:hypothetical protein n=1 Tax=Actinocrispum wychmicini TaxID=1213861 RepID=UPI003C7C42D9
MVHVDAVPGRPPEALPEVRPPQRLPFGHGEHEQVRAILQEQFVEHRDARREFNESSARRGFGPATLLTAQPTRLHGADRRRGELVDGDAALGEDPADFQQWRTDIDAALVGVVFVGLLSDQFAPAGAGVEVHQAQHEPGQAQGLVEPHGGSQGLGRGRDEVFGIVGACGDPDAVARVGGDEPGAHDGVHDGGEGGEDGRHSGLSELVVQFGDPFLDLHVAVEDRDHGPVLPLRQQVDGEVGAVLVRGATAEPWRDRVLPFLDERAEGDLGRARVGPQVTVDEGFLLVAPLFCHLFGGEAGSAGVGAVGCLVERAPVAWVVGTFLCVGQSSTPW